MNEHQEESGHSSVATSEKENRTVSQGTEATQPATSLDEEPEIADYGPLPSKAQMQYHREELAAFIHFGMNTYYDREWGDGQEDPYYFTTMASSCTLLNTPTIPLPKVVGRKEKAMS